MMLTRRAATFAAFCVLLLACGDGDHDATRGPCSPALHRAAFRACQQATDQATCEAAGGSWGRGGLSQDFRCFCPTGQGGCPCTEVSECLGSCVGPVPTSLSCPGVTAGTCQEVVPTFGCACTLFPERGFVGFCSD